MTRFQLYLSEIKTNIVISTEDMKKALFKESIFDDFLYDIKFISFSDIENDILGSLTEDALIKVKNELGISYEASKVYLDYYLLTNSNKLEKMDREKEYIFNEKNIEYYRDKNILVFLPANYNNLIYKTLSILKKENIDFTLISYQKEDDFERREIIEFPNIVSEVEGIANEIARLLSKGIDINKIKVSVTESTYYTIIVDVFNSYDFDYYFKKRNSLIEIEEVIEMINFFRTSNAITVTKEAYDIYKSNAHLSPETSQILDNVIYKKDVHEIDYLIYELKQVSIPLKEYRNAIAIGNFMNSYIESDDYLFILGANQGLFPPSISFPGLIDDEVISTNNLETEMYFNNFIEDYYSSLVNSLKYVVISYKNIGLDKEYIKSSLLDSKKIEGFTFKKNYFIDERFSKKRDLFTLYKALEHYNRDKMDSLEYQKLNNIGTIDKISVMGSYSSDFTLQNSSSMKDFLDGKLKLSYTTLEDFYKCPFKYLCDSHFHLDPFKDTFSSYIGSFFHKFVEHFFDKEFDQEKVDRLYEEFRDSSSYSLSPDEVYYFRFFYENLEEILNEIHSFFSNIRIKNVIKEEKTSIKEYIDHIQVEVKGFPDLLIEDENGNISVFDYKTGSVPKIDLENGLGMQMYIYIYLYKKAIDPNKEPFGIFYIHVLKNKKEGQKKFVEIKHHFVSDEEKITSTFYEVPSKYKPDIVDFDADLELVENKINNAAKKIISGSFSITPSKSSCQFCNYKEVCYSAHVTNEEEEDEDDE